MRMTKSEEKILKWFRSRLLKPTTPEQIADFFYRGRQRPKNWRTSIVALLRRVSDKSPYASDIVLTRRSGLGRGKTAEYLAREQTGTSPAARRRFS